MLDFRSSHMPKSNIYPLIAFSIMQMKKILGAIVMWMALMLWGVVFAQTENLNVMNLPPLTQYVTDFAGVVDQKTLDEFNVHAYQYDQLSGHQFVVVLIPDRQWKELFDIALKLFNDNGIWGKQENDGLLLVIATSEKKIRIMVGYGLEWEMPDVLASKIIEEDIRPLVNSGDIAWAIRAFYTRSEQAIAAGEWKHIDDDLSNKDEEWFLFFIALAGFAIGKWLRAWKGKSKKQRWSMLIIPVLISIAVLVGGAVSIGIGFAIASYLFGWFAGFFLGSWLFFMPRWPRGGFGGWFSSGGFGWGWSFGWFSWGGGSSWGGGAWD